MTLSKNLGVTPDISIIVVNEVFPGKNLEIMLNSTKRITSRYETILITCNIETGLDVEQYLLQLLDYTPNLVKTTIVLLDFDRGPAYGRNIGAALARSANLLFADDDAMVLDDVTPLLQYLRSGVCQGVQPLILKLTNNAIVDSAGDFVKKSGRIFYYPYSRGAGTYMKTLLNDLYVEEIPSMRSAFMIVQKEAFMAIGGFDVTFNFNLEDVDLGWRMVSAGYKLLFVPTVKALHKGGRTAAPSAHDEVNRLLLLNFHAIHLKITRYSYWPYIFARFQKILLISNFSKIKRRKTAFFDAVRDIIIMNRLFTARVKQALMLRRILAEGFHFRGKEKLEDMAKGKRFIYHQTFLQRISTQCTP